MAEDLSGGAPAPAETVAAPETPAAAPAERAFEPSPRNAIDRAFEAVEKAEKPAATEAAKVGSSGEAEKPAGERERNPDGTFKARVETAAAPELQPQKEPAKVEVPKPEAGGLKDAPSRFSPDAKAAWVTVPDAVKGEVHRAFRELEQGIEKHREDATIYNDVFKPYVDMALRSNIDPSVQLAEYVKIDQALAKDFTSGIGMIFKNAGIDVREWAQKLVAQPAGQPPSSDPRDQTISELRREIAEIRQNVGGVNQTLRSQHEQGINHSLEAFVGALPAADQALFKELDNEIAAELRDSNTTLSEAFNRAKTVAQARYTKLFGPQTPTVATPAPQTSTPPPGSDPAKGKLSVSGAPGAGMSPDTRPSPTRRDAIDRAFATVGIG